MSLVAKLLRRMMAGRPREPGKVTPYVLNFGQGYVLTVYAVEFATAAELNAWEGIVADVEWPMGGSPPSVVC